MFKYFNEDISEDECLGLLLNNINFVKQAIFEKRHMEDRVGEESTLRITPKLSDGLHDIEVDIDAFSRANKIHLAYSYPAIGKLFTSNDPILFRILLTLLPVHEINMRPSKDFLYHITEHVANVKNIDEYELRHCSDAISDILDEIVSDTLHENRFDVIRRLVHIFWKSLVKRFSSRLEYNSISDRLSVQHKFHEYSLGPLVRCESLFSPVYKNSEMRGISEREFNNTLSAGLRYYIEHDRVYPIELEDMFTGTSSAILPKEAFVSCYIETFNDEDRLKEFLKLEKNNFRGMAYRDRFSISEEILDMREFKNGINRLKIINGVFSDE